MRVRNCFHRFLAVQRGFRKVAETVQHGTRRLDIDGIVVNHKHGNFFCRGTGLNWCRLRRRFDAALCCNTARNSVKQLLLTCRLEKACRKKLVRLVTGWHETRGEQHHRYFRPSSPGPDGTGQAEAVHLGHVHVGDDDVRQLALTMQ